jgi:predicted aminopeptidase
MLGAAMLLFSGCYLSTQASSFLAMQGSAKSTEKMLSGDSLDDETREFLERVNAIKSFGETGLGLSRGKNFTTYVALGRDWVALVVHAAPELSVEPYLWNYPVVGKLPYKGFYKREDALKEAEKLKAKGLDVIIRPVEAFSTLGYFKDPLYSFMLKYDEAALANLILHEETHATLFLKKHAGFNEEFASFVGDEGAFLYLDFVHGKDAGEATRKKARDDADDSRAFAEDMKALAERLRSVYNSESLSREEKLAQKEAVIAAFKEEFARSYPSRYKTQNYAAFGGRTVNNAYISLFLLYGERRNRFEEIYAPYGGDLRAFIADVARVTKKAKDPWLALESLRR